MAEIPVYELAAEQKKKTETMSFRVDGHILDKLRRESESQGINLNVLANKIFTRYVELDMFEPKVGMVGMVPIAKPIVSVLFEKLTEKETIELANKIGHGIVSDIVTFMKRTCESSKKNPKEIPKETIVRIMIMIRSTR